MNHACPGCGSRECTTIYVRRSVPVSSCMVLRSLREAVAVPRGDIHLKACSSCLLIFNAAFRDDLVRYGVGYEESQVYSSTYSQYQDGLINELIERHEVQSRRVLEIGCGKGDFLRKICEVGGNSGIGFDPTFDPDRMTADADKVVFVRDFFSSVYASIEADFYCCLMTLEHIGSVGDFLTTVRCSMGDQVDRVLFLQVPNARRILEQHTFEDVYYEHCNYFSSDSLRRLLARHGFHVEIVDERYDNQYLTAEARPAIIPPAAASLSPEPASWTATLSGFAHGVEQSLGRWQQLLHQLKAQGKRAVLWGGGSKAAAILDLLGAADLIPYVVDINPFRQDGYLPGSGVQVKHPGFLRSFRPDVVVVVNPIYRDEVANSLSGLGVTCELV